MSLEIFLGYVFGAITTLSGICLNHYLNNKKEAEKELRFKIALKALFLSTLESYENYLKHPTSVNWDSRFWADNQIKIAEYYPAEAAYFAEIVSANLAGRASHETITDLSYLRENISKMSK